MNYLYALLLVFTFSVSAFAQPDNGKKTVVIPRLKDPEIKANNIPAVAATPRFKPMEFSSSVLDNDKPLTFPKEGNKTVQIGEAPISKPEKFANPYEIPKNALPKPQGDDNTKVFRRNQSFGEFKTKANSIVIRCRDHMAVDGDIVKVYINNMVVAAHVELFEDYKVIQIGLTPGFNKLDFEALNQGTSGPNTALFVIFDDKGNLITSNQWDLATGFKGSVMIIKE
ncbi:hypothetical protein LZZ90_11260 [Flavobacterium sp. SM15]|uniref:hypothetical protein n=1 Tax=Flavobacterium sp. SM15 TaxID=2908005 RepID=UPI001EDA527E|nr:hypothetical protein [Flavobacterium sp. SM15]MCG2612086.1 hypothetical protein [Flavobacterium sp. SM15]